MILSVIVAATVATDVPAYSPLEVDWSSGTQEYDSPFTDTTKCQRAWTVVPQSWFDQNLDGTSPILGARGMCVFYSQEFGCGLYVGENYGVIGTPGSDLGLCGEYTGENYVGTISSIGRNLDMPEWTLAEEVTTTKASNSKLGDGEIIGIVLGAFTFLVLAVLIVQYCHDTRMSTENLV